MNVTLIIPAKNEADCIGNVLADVDPQVINEVLVVDGHSTDGTREVVKKHGFKVIEQEGMGYGAAIKTGIKHASGEYIVLVDADGSYNLGDIPKLLACLEKGYDIAYGSRYLPESGSDDDTIIRYIGNKSFTLMLNLLHGVNISDSLFFYIATKKKVFESLNVRATNFEYCIEFPIKAHKAGYSCKEVPSYEKKRISGDSKVNAFIHGLIILWVMIREKF